MKHMSSGYASLTQSLVIAIAISFQETLREGSISFRNAMTNYAFTHLGCSQQKNIKMHSIFETKYLKKRFNFNVILFYNYSRL